MGFEDIVAKLRRQVDGLDVSDEVVELLMPSGAPHDVEQQLWDYKESLPVLDPLHSAAMKAEHRAAIGDLIKDVVSFHNAYGGYILFGVADKGEERIRGCEAHLDCGAFNRSIQAYTDVNIECIFRRIQLGPDTALKSGSILLIPRRKNDAAPVSFKKDGPEKQDKKKSFYKGTYVRVRDESRPATNTNEDWKFLHSDRDPEPKSVKRKPLVCVLPARDPELVGFVGRTDSLAKLRAWLGDLRSPTRLITGIGGLGKTTLAYRFVEEIISLQSVDVETVIWLTAKQQTYSALHGRLVGTGKVDFSDLDALLRRVLEIHRHSFGEEEEDISLDEVVERVVEALSIVPTLLIIDDIDSLSPDCQKEAVATLNAIAVRTISSTQTPSRVLMTSRLDQGMSPTSVIKISGLEEPEFRNHMNNLCDIFTLPRLSVDILTNCFTVSSGSPLFGASLVRLFKLGENPSELPDIWLGQDGDEVRRFAFERELTRLTPPQARLLYAIILLGETNLQDLATVLSVTSRVVRDAVSELQAYHLIATRTKETGEAAIAAASDLAAVAPLLEKHLGKSIASTVEQACASAQIRSDANEKAVGLGIRNIVAAWDKGRFEEAVILAGQLRQKYPKNGDASSICGAALLKVSPPRARDADLMLEEAKRLGCVRPELIENLISAKSLSGDWPGVYNLTKPISSNNPRRDIYISAFIQAATQLVSIANDRKEYNKVAALCIEVVEKIASKTNRRVDPTLFSSLVAHKLDFAREYLAALTRDNTRPGDQLEIFEGVYRLAESQVLVTDLISKGVKALLVWWRDVEQRQIRDHTAAMILGKQIQRLNKIDAKVRQLDDVAKSRSLGLEAISHDLAHRAMAYLS